MKARRPEDFMLRAVELSRKGFPAPNPHVGCVIAKGQKTIGEGYHAYAGGPHAEVVALQQAGVDAAGADVYVTLEPCNHTGRTGPCSEALIEAGVKSVTYSVSDPNPRAAGGGERLRAAGISVFSGLAAVEAASANSVFLAAMSLGRPYVTLKVACSLDGKIALLDGRSQWITGPAARDVGHRFRAEMGAVLVGANTVLTDNPRLTARIEGVVIQPVRVILDPDEVVHETSKVFEPPGEVLQFVARATRPRHVELDIIDGQFDLTAVLRELWARGITSLLVEGGGATIGGFLSRELFERLECFLAPKILGKGISWTGDYSIGSLEGALDLRIFDVKRLDTDLWISLSR